MNYLIRKNSRLYGFYSLPFLVTEVRVFRWYARIGLHLLTIQCICSCHHRAFFNILELPIGLSWKKKTSAVYKKKCSFSSKFLLETEKVLKNCAENVWKLFGCLQSDEVGRFLHSFHEESNQMMKTWGEFISGFLFLWKEQICSEQLSTRHLPVWFNG